MRRVFWQSHPCGISVFIIIVLILTIYFGCSEEPPVTPPPPEPPKAVSLKLVDVSCTEAFIKVTAADSVLPLSISLAKDESTFANFILTKTDTVVIDTTLQPDKTYIYQTTETINGKEEKSDTLQVKSLKITSNNFTWQTFTFGDYAARELYDCAVISDDDIWCVGIFGLLDTSQVGYTIYNAVHWNGSEWENKLINFYTICGQPSYSPYPAKAIFAADAELIWIAADGNEIAKIENGIQTEIICLPQSFVINKMWGISENDFYIVGNGGNILHYQNLVWHSLVSGTNLNLNDIWGYYEKTTGEQTILVAGGNILMSTERIILRINGNEVEEVNPEGTEEYPFGSVWIPNNYKYYITGPGLYTRYNYANQWNHIPTPFYYIYSIRGNRLNDIIVAGGLGYVGHFNGVSWINYIGNGLEEIAGNYYGAGIKGNIVVVVGYLGEQAVAVIGRR
jgi:hypothetical protein